jgi:outer membrane protein TolC
MPEDESAWQAAVGITVPLWKGGKQDALAREASARVTAARHGLEAERLRAGVEIEEEYARLVAERELVRRFDEEVLPMSRLAFDAARASYLAGRTTILILLESLRNHIELETMHYEHLADAERSLARLEAATGRTIGAMIVDWDAALEEETR